MQIRRGGILESVHHGAIAVADPEGKLVAWWADPDAVTFLRSAAKPFQALPLLESGAAEQFGLTDPEIALACASHTGTDEHVAAVAALQAKTGIREADLQCGTHTPIDRETAFRLRRSGESPTPNRHNCSGKHTAMLATAKRMGAPLDDYLDPRHPVQLSVTESLSEMTGIAADRIGIGIDGCSAPNFALPLREAATAFARLADPSALPPERAKACRHVFRAMTSNPEMVSGPGHFDTRLMQVAEGRVLSKGGAEGYLALALPPRADEARRPALGIALKIADGDRQARARFRVALSVLDALGALNASEKEALAEYGSRTLTNHRGLEVGELELCFRLEWAQT